MNDAVERLCARVGVQPRYRGFGGETVEVSRDTRIAVLRALGFDIAPGSRAEASARDHLRSLQAAADTRPLDDVLIVAADTPSTHALRSPAQWLLEAEGSSVPLASGARGSTLRLPRLPVGIHRLRTDPGQATEQTTWVLSRPAGATRLADKVPQARIWGVLAALYGLTDGARAPLGRYDLLGAYAREFAGQGADFLGINPVHAMGDHRPDDVISPYSPSHRGFLNTWHCAFPGGPSGAADALVDYPSALGAQDQALRAGFAAFSDLPASAPERAALAAFVEDAGRALDDYALFEVLAARHGADWRDWPAAFRDRDPSALAEVARHEAHAMARTRWAQWQAHDQLADAQQAALAAGMRVGLYLDLAVGPRLGGAETWAARDTFVSSVTLGAPPDPLGPSGQSWGLAPLSPLGCRADGFAGFARLLRAVMRHAGMIRIDHVIGLMRSFWIPDGATEGTFVSYPLEALLAVVAIESARNDTIVVGEDLGLVPEGLRDRLAASGIYGLDVLQYMRTASGGFADTSRTRRKAICGFATHDTPTIAGFFSARDARERAALGGVDADALAATLADRQRAKATLTTADPVTEIHRRLARSNAEMVAIQLDDIAGIEAQQNLPGTIDTHPNWRRKTPLTLDMLSGTSALTGLADDMAAARRSNPTALEQKNELCDCSDHPH